MLKLLVTKLSTFPSENVFPSMESCESLLLQGFRCEWGAGVLNLGLLLMHTLKLVPRQFGSDLMLVLLPDTTNAATAHVVCIKCL